MFFRSFRGVKFLLYSSFHYNRRGFCFYFIMFLIYYFNSFYYEGGFNIKKNNTYEFNSNSFLKWLFIFLLLSIEMFFMFLVLLIPVNCNIFLFLISIFSLQLIVLDLLLNNFTTKFF
uniref:hypothetical protein n=1 Tax=Thelohanellus kitauei TaxID=669202 RepID=UPI0030030CA9